ncbi:MAG: B12-binding domain-containing radical SAM protein [Chloroflexi bacterium]|nr:B12-binding domain-containing radical SAM protein [Chloroflexota bacterium]|tara:strand:+ start:3976 stop:5484 length:1509 start_codon:yes stop_codon:yes gene_type:complete
MEPNKGADLLLINPGNQQQIYQSLANNISAIEPPIWIGLLASFAMTQGYSVEIIDANAEGLSPKESANQTGDINPTLVCVVAYGQQPSASTQNMPACTEVCKSIKEMHPHIPMILIGGHVASLPERTLKESDVDFVSDGEGLHTLVQLIEAIKSGSKRFDKVQGLLYWESDHIRRTPSAPLLNSLDTQIPSIPWQLFPMDKYRAHNWHCLDSMVREPYAAIYTTLGCPYHCDFCCIQAPFKSGENLLGYGSTINSYRRWTPESIIKQIDILVQDFNVKNIKIADELFVLNPRHVEGICDLIIERGYELNIWAYTRVDTVQFGIGSKLKNAGFNWLACGIEAANEQVRDSVQKGFDQEDIYKTLNFIRQEGINVIGNYIFGLPDDNMATMQETLDMAIDLNCEFANFYCAMAYPGSELYNIALKEGWSLPKTWDGYSQHSVDTQPLPTKYLSSSEVLKFRDNAFNTYFTGQKYQDMISTKFGSDKVAYINDMLAVGLERRLAY